MTEPDYIQVFYQSTWLKNLPEEELKNLETQVKTCFTKLTPEKINSLGIGSVVYAHCATDSHERFGTLEGFAKMTIDMTEGEDPNCTYLDSGLRSAINSNSTVYDLTNPEGIKQIVEKYGQAIVERPTGLMWYIN